MASGSTTATESSQTASRRKPTPRLSILITQSDENAWKQLSPTTVSAELASSRPSRSVLTSRVSQLEEYFSSAVDTTVPESSGVNSTGETKTWAIKGLDMLGHIRSNLRLDVIPETESPVSGCSPFSDHDDVIPDPFPEVSQSRKQSRKLSDHIDIHKPLDSIPTLRAHLNSLQSRLSSLEVSLSESVAELPSRTDPGNLIQTVKSLETVTQVSAEIKDGEEDLESTAIEIAEAIQLSLNGEQLITYSALPENWKNNPFVRGGYRFIPLQQLPRLIFSPFSWHNETANIHTHFLPFLFWSLQLIPTLYGGTHRTDTPMFIYSLFSLFCLFTSTIWHTMAGCASPRGMELCARIDYVGIGWHISATLATIVFYGFQHHPIERDFFLGLCVLMGLSGTVTPFFPWFNQRKYKPYRNAYFMLHCIAYVAPIVHLCFMYSPSSVIRFVSHLSPSVSMYVIGFVIFATYFPESFFNPDGQHHWLDWVGGGSHALWHVFVVLGMSLHRQGMVQLAKGVEMA